MTPQPFPTLPPRPSRLGLAVRLAFATLAALMVCVGAEARPPARWVKGELLVGFRAGVGPGDRHAFYGKQGATFIQDVGQGIRVVRIRVPIAAEDAILRRLSRLPQVKFAEKNYEYAPALVPDDPEFVNQWHLPKILAPDAWDVTQGGAGAVIAILDSGVEATHPDLAGTLVAGYNTFSNSTDTSDAFGHGTEVAGVAGALTNNTVGVAGVAGAAPIMPVRVTNSTGGATSASIANGIVWAADHGARVVNLSFDGIAGNATIRAAAEYAYNKGTLVVAAAGNCQCVDPTPENPFVLSVSGTDEVDGLGYYSTTGPFVDLSAPGSNILTTAKFGLYFAETGTSLASPVVAGVAALMFSANQTLTPAVTTQLLESTAVDIGGDGYDQNFGYGRVNALAAVNAAAAYVTPPDLTPPTTSMTAPTDLATVSGTAVIDVAADDNVGVFKVDLYVDGIFFVSDTTSPYSFAWDTTVLPNGPHTLYAIAADAAGNSASTTLITVTVDNKPPDLTPPNTSIDAPTGSVPVSGTTTVTVGASDDVGVTQVELYLDSVSLGVATAAPYSFSWNTTLSPDGSHTLDAVASDAAGNMGHASLVVTVANAVGHPPVAVYNWFQVHCREKWTYTPRVLNVLANDRDVDGDINPATVSIRSGPNKGGSLRVNADGTVSYTPRKEFRGTETFRYNVRDMRGAVSNIATVNVKVR